MFATASRRLWLALAISLLAHLALLLVHFSLPEHDRKARDRGLEVILVNSRSQTAPASAQALAQAKLDGGGSADAPRRARTPLPPAAENRRGSALEEKQRQVRALEEKQQQLLLQAQHNAPATASAATPAPPLERPRPDGRALAEMTRNMLRMEAEIARNIDQYNERPRKKNLGVRTDEYRFAQYMEDWRRKVERIGTLNYPEAARGRLYGSLLLSVSINADGSVLKVEINRSSGHRLLDEAALRIVHLAAPYAAFPPDIRRDTDIIEITRTWTFTRRDALQAN